MHVSGVAAAKLHFASSCVGSKFRGCAGTAKMQKAVVQKCLKGTKLGALLDQGLQPVPQNTSGATLSGCKLWSSNLRCLSEKRCMGFGVRENAATFVSPGLVKHRLRKAQITAIGEETSNGYVRLETDHNQLKQSNGGAPQGGPGSSGGKQEGAPTAASSGAKGDLTTEQKAALQALDAQLNTLSDTDAKAGQRNARRKFAEDLARKSGKLLQLYDWHNRVVLVIIC